MKPRLAGVFVCARERESRVLSVKKKKGEARPSGQATATLRGRFVTPSIIGRKESLL